MAIKTFTTGEVLTASDTNTYLANSGLVHIKQVTIGSAVSSVAVTNVFSSTYGVYKVVMSGGAVSGSLPNLQFQFAGITSGTYFGGWVGARFNTGAVTGLGLNAATSWTYAGQHSNGTHIMDFTIWGANLSSRKYCATGVTLTAAGDYGTFVGECTGSSVETGFNIIASAGTMTGGTINVYGYRLG
jgi:hypothetical protein